VVTLLDSHPLNPGSVNAMLCQCTGPGGGSPDGNVPHVEVLHVVRALHVVVHDALSCAAKRLNGVNLALLQGTTKATSMSI